MLRRKDFIKLTDTITSKKGKIFNKDEIFRIDFIGKNSSFLLMRNKENQFVFDINEIEGKYIIIEEWGK